MPKDEEHDCILVKTISGKRLCTSSMPFFRGAMNCFEPTSLGEIAAVFLRQLVRGRKRTDSHQLVETP